MDPNTPPNSNIPPSTPPPDPSTTGAWPSQPQTPPPADMNGYSTSSSPISDPQTAPAAPTPSPWDAPTAIPGSSVPGSSPMPTWPQQDTNTSPLTPPPAAPVMDTATPTWSPPQSPVDQPAADPAQPTPTFVPSPVPEAPVPNQGWDPSNASSAPSFGAPDSSSVQGGSPFTPPGMSNNMPPESAPTDLSQLIDNSAPVSTDSGVGGLPPTAQDIPGVVNATPPPAEGAPSQVVTDGGHGGIPKWILIVGGLVLILVIAASAYFILGIGQAKPQSTSVPVEVGQQPLTNPPAVVPTATSTPEATNSGATFGTDTTTQATASGKSAIDLLKARQKTQ